MPRLADLSDLIRLSRITANPLETLRFRKREHSDANHQVLLRCGRKLSLRGGFADFHMFHRIFVRDEYQVRPLCLAGLGNVIDLGGNVGLFAARIAPFAERVVTCEPIPRNFAQLQINTARFDNILAEPVAITRTTGTTRIYTPVDPGVSGGYSSHRDGDGARLSEDHATVPAMRFADLLEKHAIDSIDLLKIDVEGAEYDILHDAVELLPNIRRIHAEYHDVQVDQPRSRIENFAAFLRAQGYHLDIQPHKRIRNHGHLFASRVEQA